MLKMQVLPVGETQTPPIGDLSQEAYPWLKGGEWVIVATTTTTTTAGYPATVERSLRPRPKQNGHKGCVRARLSITPIPPLLGSN